MGVKLKEKNKKTQLENFLKTPQKQKGQEENMKRGNNQPDNYLLGKKKKKIWKTGKNTVTTFEERKQITVNLAFYTQ